MAVRAEGVGGGPRSEFSSSAITELECERPRQGNKGFLKGTDVIAVKRKEKEKQSSKSTMKQESQTPLPLQAISYEEMSQNVRLVGAGRPSSELSFHETSSFVESVGAADSDDRLSFFGTSFEFEVFPLQLWLDKKPIFFSVLKMGGPLKPSYTFEWVSLAAYIILLKL